MKKVQLGTVIHSLNTGLNPRKFFQLNTPDAEFYYVTIKEMVDGKIVYNENTDRLNDKALELCNRRSNLEKGDVLFSGTGTIGKTVVLTETPTTWNIKEGVYTIKPKSELLNSSYLAYALGSEPIKNIYMSNVAGGTVKSLKMADLEKTEIPLPSLSEQQKIVAELDTIQSAIDNKKQQLALLDELVKSRFIEMFGDIIEKSEKIDLEKICEFVTVGIANSATHAFCEQGIIMFRNQNIKEDFLDDSDVIYIKQNFAEKYKSKSLKENDLLIVRTGYPGVCCLVPKKYEGCQTFTTLIARLKERNDINPKFICHYINSKYGREYVEKNQAGVAQQNFGATALSKMPMVIPPIELQNDFADFVQQIDKSKFVVKQQLADLQELLDSKMQEYFG